MYEINGIVCAKDSEKPVTVVSARAMGDYKLWVRFSTGDVKTFDFSPLLNTEAFRPLRDKAMFNSVYVDYGVTVWNDGTIDIAPEYLYRNGS